MNENDEGESLFYLGTGPLSAILLGMALVPLREWTTASNLAFAFMALTIVVAEWGGRWAAVATALFSALSLNFFLTKPYLRLAIHDPDDVIAFVGLALCGLVAAALGSRRGRTIHALTALRKQRDVLRALLRGWDVAASLEPQLETVLRQARDAFPLVAAVVRDDRNGFVAGAFQPDGLRPVPDTVLHSDTLLP